MTGSANPPRDRSLLAVAIEREDWDLAALCLVYGALKAVEALPKEVLEELLTLLEENSHG
jgi:hypothetical protein